MLALLAFSVFINYIDRGNLSIAAPMLKDELGMSASQLGSSSSFFWTYSLFLILSGWLVDRVSVSWVMAIGFFLRSAPQRHRILAWIHRLNGGTACSRHRRVGRLSGVLKNAGEVFPRPPNTLPRTQSLPRGWPAAPPSACWWAVC